MKHGRSEASQHTFKGEPMFMKASKNMLALSTRGACLNKLKNKQVSGGIFEFIKHYKQMQELEAAKNAEMEKLNQLHENVADYDAEIVIN